MLSRTTLGVIDAASQRVFMIRSVPTATAEPPQANASVPMATALSAVAVAVAVVSPLS